MKQNSIFTRTLVLETHRHSLWSYAGHSLWREFYTSEEIQSVYSERCDVRFNLNETFPSRNSLEEKSVLNTNHVYQHLTLVSFFLLKIKTNGFKYCYGPPHMADQKLDDQLEHTYSSYVRIRDVALKTCQRRWMTGWSGERGSAISVLAARHDDDDDDDCYLTQIILFKTIHLFAQSKDSKYCYAIPIIQFLHWAKQFQVFLSNKNNTIKYYSFVCMHLNVSKYCYLAPIVLFAHG